MTNLNSLFAVSAIALVTALTGQASAGQIKLSTPDGSVEMTGDLIGFSGTEYTVLSSVGVVTVAAGSVLCEGAVCPDVKKNGASISVASLRPEADLIKIVANLRPVAERRNVAD